MQLLRELPSPSAPWAKGMARVLVWLVIVLPAALMCLLFLLLAYLSTLQDGDHAPPLPFDLAVAGFFAHIAYLGVVRSGRIFYLLLYPTFVVGALTAAFVFHDRLLLASVPSDHYATAFGVVIAVALLVTVRIFYRRLDRAITRSHHVDV